MHFTRNIDLILCCLIGIVLSGNVTNAQDSAHVKNQRIQQLQLQADSLKSEWNVLWRKSDSLRVESMFLRMKSDSVLRAIKQYNKQPVLNQDSAFIPSATDSLILQSVRAKSHKPGTTVSDTITKKTMLVIPDTGIASYYGKEFHGRKTSSGKTYNMHDYTCAHRWLPFGSVVRIKNISNGKQVLVTVNDRGPWKHGRIVDVSYKAAVDLGLIGPGTAKVEIQSHAESEVDSE